jgi:hypothetical protein
VRRVARNPRLGIARIHSYTALCYLASQAICPLVLLGFTVVYGLLFMALLTYFYEMFLFDPGTFTAFRSSLVFTLGFSAFPWFAIAYILLAVITGTATANGTMPSGH